MQNLNLASIMLGFALLALIGLRLGKRYSPPEDEERRQILGALEKAMWVAVIITLPLTLYALWRR